ncbi:leucine-rich repeat domain-containing protein [Candidatus Methanarcanum hacksteinii]|uniref:leucine-rich repeat domain-containing protein n=1 Tax=Candidatus Methanarcanum hacksteinii TaxID=2911857 RepID=UPI0037DCB42B
MKIWKIFSLLFVVGVVSIVACAMISDDSSAEVTSGTTGDCTWTLDGTKLTISGNGAIADYEYSKPSPWGRSITEVIIENGVTSIGDGVFSGCKSLTSIIIPDSVTSIGNWASDRCISLTNVSIGNGVTSIGEEAFYSCESLTSITIPNSVTYIGESAFSGCTSFTSITIPNSVTSIGDGAFGGCESLTSITIPDSVTSIGNNAFGCCTSLTNVSIGNGVTSIEYGAFYNCTSLTSITIPNSVTSIGWGAFDNCTSLTSITIPNSVTTIGEWPFHPFGFYESNGVDIIEPIAENLAGHTFINKSGKMVKQEEAPPSVTKYTVTFRVNGNVIDTVSYENGATTITEPKIPNIKGYDARWPQYTLSGDIIVDAVLTPKEYKVIYKVDENVVFTDVYKYDSKVIIRDTYSDGKYTYTPWTTKDVIVSDESFTIIDSDIIFESTSFAVKYTFIVKYVDTDGKEIHPQYQGEARCEAIISPDIPSISGYRSPDERISIKITEDPSKNVVTYTYYLEDVETEGSSGFPMTSVVVGAIVAVIAIAAIAFVIKKH